MDRFLGRGPIFPREDIQSIFYVPQSAEQQQVQLEESQTGSIKLQIPTETAGLLSAVRFNCREQFAGGKEFIRFFFSKSDLMQRGLTSYLHIHSPRIY